MDPEFMSDEEFYDADDWANMVMNGDGKYAELWERMPESGREALRGYGYTGPTAEDYAELEEDDE